jgi:hypothetical protein
MIKWLKELLSSSSKASIRRFIGLQSFYLLITIGIFALFSKTLFANVLIIKQVAEYLFAIVMATIVGTTVTNLADIIKPPQQNEGE